MAGTHMALDIRIAGRYRLGRKIGSGSFGDIYLGAWAQPRHAALMLPARTEQKAAGLFTWEPHMPACCLVGTHIQTGEEVGIKLVRS